MKIFKSINKLNKQVDFKANIGFVPTMGALHKGHMSLIDSSKKKCKKTLVSIFVNPTQFNNKRDYSKYPRNRKKDLKILKGLKVNFVFIPNKRDIYNFKRKIRLAKKDKILCAKYRKGHFEGVIDVMDRLSKLIKPKKIFMGEKDFQQFFLVRNYLKKRVKSKVILCKTIRDNHKLALSSRNLHLNNKELNTARLIAKRLSNFKNKLNKTKNIKDLISIKREEFNHFKNIKVEYFELRNKLTLKKTTKIKNSKIFIAHYLKDVRLIDNF